MASQEQQVENEYAGDWTERFIQEIQKRPAIYNNRLPEHSDRQISIRLWHEICAAMVPSWEILTSVEKSKTEKELQGKWRNLRTCFRRELKKQKYGSSGQAARKRRKCVFFDQLLFLLPTLDDRPTTSECSPPQAGNASADSDNDEGSEIMDRSQQSEIGSSQLLIETRQPTNKQTDQPDKGASKKQAKKTETYEQTLLNILKEKKEEAFDEDKSFLLSLVPTFKKLNDSQKLDAKMEFLATLKRLTQPSQPQRSNSFYHMPVAVGYPNYRQPNYNNYHNQHWQPPMTIPPPHTSGSSRESGIMSLDRLSPNEFSNYFPTSSPDK